MILFLYIKMVNEYYQKHKERLQKETRERYQNLSEEERNKKGVSTIRNVGRSCLSIEEIVI